MSNYLETDDGIATTALYKAAEKAGFADDLRHAKIDIVVRRCPGGGKCACVDWDVELDEDPDFEFPLEAYKRANNWLRAYSARKGWEV